MIPFLSFHYVYDAVKGYQGVELLLQVLIGSLGCCVAVLESENKKRDDTLSMLSLTFDETLHIFMTQGSSLI